jgi:threonine/homoserine/homoserine lactone efflux protein
MAVASFILGLLGLLVMNIFLGPLALVLAGLALRRGTSRRGRALLGLFLGAADLVVLAVLVSADSTVSWSFTG